MELPAISVVIPMYNAEKYVGECLDSLLAQTFQDFEVIVVNDCSTDNSVAVVESYAEKFGGRLKIARTKKNSGCGGIPRNMGMMLSRGEYISFLDADDVITPTAFEELYSVAKKFDADVVACEKYYRVPEKRWYDSEFRKTLKPFGSKKNNFVTEPTLLTNNFFERVQSLCQTDFLWSLWSKLIRRDCIFNNEIFSAKTIIDDFIFTNCLIFSAERFVLVPNIVNYYRVLEESISHTATGGLAYFRKYVRALTAAFRHFDEFLSGKDFFRQHPDQKYLALNVVWNECTSYLTETYNQIDVYEFDEIVREEFYDGNNIALTAFAFNIANLRGNQFRQLLVRVNELEKSAQRDKTYIAELEKSARQDKAYIAELENFIAQFVAKSKE